VLDLVFRVRFRPDSSDIAKETKYKNQLISLFGFISILSLIGIPFKVEFSLSK